MSDATVTIASGSGVDLSLSSAITSAADQLDTAPIYSSTSLDDTLLDSGDRVRSASQMWSDQQGEEGRGKERGKGGAREGRRGERGKGGSKL